MTTKRSSTRIPKKNNYDDFQMSEPLPRRKNILIESNDECKNTRSSIRNISKVDVAEKLLIHSCIKCYRIFKNKNNLKNHESDCLNPTSSLTIVDGDTPRFLSTPLDSDSNNECTHQISSLTKERNALQSSSNKISGSNISFNTSCATTSIQLEDGLIHCPKISSLTKERNDLQSSSNKIPDSNISSNTSCATTSVQLEDGLTHCPKILRGSANQVSHSKLTLVDTSSLNISSKEQCLKDLPLSKNIQTTNSFSISAATIPSLHLKILNWILLLITCCAVYQH